MSKENSTIIQQALDEAIERALNNSDGKKAAYIPELETVPEELTNISVKLTDGTLISAGNNLDYKLTLQSTAKLIVLIGMLEEFGLNRMSAWVRAEPSGDDFASVARLDQFGPVPSNPMLNAGSISLCSHIPGNSQERLDWLKKWVTTLFGEELEINQNVFASECSTGDRNRSLAYLMKSNNVLEGNIEQILETYFSLCSFEATVAQAVQLPMILANGGLTETGTRVISQDTVRNVVSLMATCGLYNESGTHFLRTGLPGKSGVSGFIFALAPHRAGIIVASPRVNRKGTSIRGEIMLEHVSQKLDWHFAL